MQPIPTIGSLRLSALPFAILTSLGGTNKKKRWHSKMMPPASPPRVTDHSKRNGRCDSKLHLVDRYYDPTTDQFWSVDPDVAETGQPYSFTGDNPLNATDPLGLCVKGFGFFCRLGHNLVHYADNGRRLVAKHKKQIITVTVIVAFVAVVIVSASDGGESGGVGDVDEPASVKGSTKSSPNFITPTNPAQLPPAEDDLPSGWNIRPGAPNVDYPNGYWKMTNEGGQAIDPSTGRPPGNVSRAMSRAMTHIPYPPGIYEGG
jgi:RHS repeat-associated protein